MVVVIKVASADTPTSGVGISLANSDNRALALAVNSAKVSRSVPSIQADMSVLGGRPR